ncbi:unnamed protein product, partial [Brassica oleracea var. botrytis]
QFQSSLPVSNTLKQLFHGSDGVGFSSFVTPALVSSVATPPSSRSAAVSAFSGAVRSSLSTTQALTPHEPPDPPPCLFSPVPFEALSPPEPPNPPDASFRLVVHLHFDTPFTLSQTYIQNLETRFPNLASGGVVSFVFFGATKSGSKGLYPAICNVFLADILSGIITVLRPFIPSPQALTYISTLKPPSRIATKNGGGGGLPVSVSDTSFAYGLLSPVVYRYLFGCIDDTSFAYGLHYPVIYRSLFGCVDWPLISPCFDLPTSRPCKVLHAHLSSLFTTYSATVEWFRQLSVWVMLGLRFMILAGDIPMGLVSFGSTFVTSSSIYIACSMQFSYGFHSGCWCCVCVSLFLVAGRRETHCHLYPYEYGCGEF